MSWLNILLEPTILLAADLLRRLNRFGEAATAYERAASLATNGIELDFLKRRLHQMEAGKQRAEGFLPR
jgi:predicted RNA polymerase sigma factor